MVLLSVCWYMAFCRPLTVAGTGQQEVCLGSCNISKLGLEYDSLKLLLLFCHTGQHIKEELIFEICFLIHYGVIEISITPNKLGKEAL